MDALSWTPRCPGGPRLVWSGSILVARIGGDGRTRNPGGVLAADQNASHRELPAGRIPDRGLRPRQYRPQTARSLGSGTLDRHNPVVGQEACRVVVKRKQARSFWRSENERQ